MLKFATLIAALMAISAFASTAEARGGGAFFATWLAHAGQKQAHENWEQSHASPHASHCEKKRELAEIEAEQAAQAEAQAAAAQRASLLAQQKREAAKLAAAKRARLLALQQQKAFAAKQAAAEQAQAPAPKLINAAPKGDQLPGAPAAPANITTASLKTTASEQSSPPSDTGATLDVCRKYSPAADGLIEVPCK